MCRSKDQTCQTRRRSSGASQRQHLVRRHRMRTARRSTSPGDRQRQTRGCAPSLAAVMPP
jgi:hypothetical protein